MEPKRILVVDDEKNIRLTLTQALESDEWQTDTAVNGEEALQKLEESEFDLMLLDPEDAGHRRHGGAAARRRRPPRCACRYHHRLRDHRIGR